MPDVDTLIIGSGAGGLAAAVALSRAGQRVLVLEQHYLPGGWCHSFPLEGYLFSPGVHYIGDLGAGQVVRTMYEGLGVANDLTILELDRNGYDRVIAGDRRFDIPAGVQAFKERLIDRFPREAAGIRGYLSAVDSLRGAGPAWLGVSGPLDVARAIVKSAPIARWGLRTASGMVNSFVSDPFLRAIFTIQSGDHGMPPSRAPAFVHTAIVGHYLDGGGYPMGGARSIPRAFLRALRANGSSIKMRAEVQRILVETTRGGRRKAIGVALADGTEIRADRVISNADPGLTLKQLVGEQHLSRRLNRRLDRTRYGKSCLSLFMAIDTDPRAFGLTSGNVWYSPSSDIDAQYDTTSRAEDIGRDGVSSLFVTATTLKDPTKVKRGHHTLEAFTYADSAQFDRWADTGHEQRPADYTALKEVLKQRMLQRLEQLFPGLTQHLVLAELGTPITNKHYVSSTTGHLYGTEKSFSQIGPFGFAPKTEIEGLFLTGASVGFHGVAGATMSGVNTAATVLRQLPSTLLRAPGQHLTVLPAEHPERWPEHLQAKLPSRVEERASA